MDIRLRIGSPLLWFSQRNKKAFRPCCSRGPSRPPPEQDNGDNKDKNSKDAFKIDWDKAWSSFKRRGKKSIFPRFNPNKYVSWNPKRSDYPLSEEVDPIKRTERSNLMLWTSPRFTLIGASVIVTFLIVYTVLAPINK
ncbi:hypothetical protein Leryth_007552 [Lithospermum erythrorhizon]|nr:hypothetical protein Leryth_007552 [Lithospermum erythrorhizon]